MNVPTKMNNISQPILQQGSIELFAHKGIAFAMIDGHMEDFNQWPERLLSIIRRDLDNHPGAESALERMGLSDPMDQLHQYVLCMYGELNSSPDFVDFKKTSDMEFTQLICGTESCKYRGILCNLIHASYGDLTPREVEISKLLAENCSSQDIADRLSISINTVNTHITNILPKIGVKDSKGVAAWAANHLIH